MIHTVKQMKLSPSQGQAVLLDTISPQASNVEVPLQVALGTFLRAGARTRTCSHYRSKAGGCWSQLNAFPAPPLLCGAH